MSCDTYLHLQRDLQHQNRFTSEASSESGLELFEFSTFSLDALLGHTLHFQQFFKLDIEIQLLTVQKEIFSSGWSLFCTYFSSNFLPKMANFECFLNLNWFLKEIWPFKLF